MDKATYLGAKQKEKEAALEKAQVAESSLEELKDKFRELRRQVGPGLGLGLGLGLKDKFRELRRQEGLPLPLPLTLALLPSLSPNPSPNSRRPRAVPAS